MGWFDETAFRTALGIPDIFRVVGVTPLGYPDQEPKDRPRKEPTDITFYKQWNNKDADQG